MSAIDVWRLCDDLTAEQAAFLVLDVDPTGKRIFSMDKAWRDPAPDGYEAAFAAITGAVKQGAIKANITFAEQRRKTLDAEGFEAYETITTDTPDWELTKIHVDSLRQWLSQKGWKSKFFFPDKIDGTPDYLNPAHPCYAPKLAAAIRAWETITTNEALLKNKSPKQAIEKWLKENANKYGLMGEDGKPNNEGIEQVSKVANWKPGGGANKTVSS